MKFDVIGHWMGEDLPKSLQKELLPDGTYEVSMEEIETLTQSFDVAITHYRQDQPTKKQLRAGAKEVPDLVSLWVDTKGGRFHVR